MLQEAVDELLQDWEDPDTPQLDPRRVEMVGDLLDEYRESFEQVCMKWAEHNMAWLTDRTYSTGGCSLRRN